MPSLLPNSPTRPAIATDPDGVSIKVNWVDPNQGDVPTASAAFSGFIYNDAHGNPATLNALQLADVLAVEAKLAAVPDLGNNNNGSATFTYSLPDKAFDFLAAGETLTLTYIVMVNNNYGPNPESTPLTFTITVTGTNDAPVITTGPESVAYSGGKFTPGGNLKTIGNVPTTGSLAFVDVDLTDTHTVATALTDASMSGPGAATLDMTALDALAPAPMAAFEQALSAVVATDSTGTGSGTINWKLADLPEYLADFIPQGETLTLTYTVTVTDSQGAISTQNVTVTITGTDAAAVVWIATTQAGSSGDWNDPSNWETGTVPTAGDDAIIITDQLQGKTPYYPVTIKAAADGGVAAFANSLTMNDFGTTAPELDNYNTLTIGAGGLEPERRRDSQEFRKHQRRRAGRDTEPQRSAEFRYDRSRPRRRFQGSKLDHEFEETIEVQGGTLNVVVDVANTGGNLTVDGGAKLTLNRATITGGKVLPTTARWP